MASVWGELKRRKVVKVAVAYAIVGWLLIEITSTVFPLVQLPDWTATFVAMLVLVGFPIALILSWAYDITPEGVVRDQGAGVAQQTSGLRTEYVFMGLLVIAVGTLLYREFSPSDQTVEVVTEESRRAVLPNSVAVLPFENLSLDPEDAFFATGIHEEILNQLAKISDMNVIARTSVLRYADGQTPISEIAEALNVETVMEGSVRYADDRVLVTAQLIDPDTDAHLWSESYNREFADVFAIQADIAVNIANALEAEFSLAEQEAIERQPTDSPAAYAHYLQALGIWYSGGSRWTALSDVNQAIEIDSEFALAYALRARVYVERNLAVFAEDRTAGVDLAELETLARQSVNAALTLDADLGKAYLALAEINEIMGRLPETRQAYERALQLSPNDVEVLYEVSEFKSFSDEHAEAIRLQQRANELDPHNSHALHRLGTRFALAGNADASITALRESIELEPTDRTTYIWLGLMQHVRGNDADAEEALGFAEQLILQYRARLDANVAFFASQLALVAYGYAQIGLREDALRSFDEIALAATDYRVYSGSRAVSYLAIDDSEQALYWLNQAASNPVYDYGTEALMLIKGNVLSDPILDQPEFVEVRTRLGFTE